MSKDAKIYTRFYTLIILFISLIFLPLSLHADPYPPDNIDASTGMHYTPAAWPTGLPGNGSPATEWKPYTRFGNSNNDPRTQDPSNGGTSPQNYVNIASSCVDTNEPSIYYYLYKDPSDATKDVIMFRWRVEQQANTYATGPSAGAYSSGDAWNSALWTVFFDLDGDGYRDIAAHLDGSSGSPSASIDRIFGIYGKLPTQSIGYEDDPANIKIIGHNPTAFVNTATQKIYNYHNTLTPDTTWSNGAAEITWDYGTTRAELNVDSPCKEYYVDYQIPVKLIDASAFGGPTLTRDTPISMLFCTSNSLNNPFQKDCAINNAWTADPNKEAPFGDFISFDRNESYTQPIVDDIKGVGCNPVKLTATVKDVLAVVNGVVVPSVKSVDFYAYRDADGDGIANDGDTWTFAVSATRIDFNTWVADWQSEVLFAGQYLVGVRATDDPLKVDYAMETNGTTNVTFSYLTQTEVNDLATASGHPEYAPDDGIDANETWWANPEITGIKDIALAVNSCGKSPILDKNVSDDTPTVGDTVTFGLTYSNPAGTHGDINLTEISDILPTGFVYDGNLTLNGFTVSAEPSIGATGKIVWTLNPVVIPAGASVSLTFDVNVSTVTGVYNNIADSNSSFGEVRSNIVPITIGSPLLNIAIAADKLLYAEGETVNYTVTYGNDSSVSTTGTVVEVNLSNLGLSTPFNISGGGVYNSGTRVITWSVGNLATGSTGNIFTFDANTTDPFDAINNPIVVPATIDSNETNLQTATATVRVNVPTPSLVIQKTANVAFVTPANSDQVIYTITVANTGTGAATDVNITDVVPAGFTYQASSPVATSAPIVGGTGTVIWNIPTLDVNTSTSVTLTLQVDNPNTATSSTNTATVVAGNVSGTKQASATIGIRNVTGGGTCTDLTNLYNPSIYIDTSDGTLSTTAVATADYNKNTATTFDIYLVPTTSNAAIYQGFSFANNLIGTNETLTTATLYFTSYSSKIDGTGQIDIYANGSLFTTQAITTSSTGSNVPSVLAVDLSSLTATQLNNLEFNATAFSSLAQRNFHTDYVKLCVVKQTSPFLTLQYQVDKLNATFTDSLLYTVRYGNSGGSDANATTITTTVPAGLENIVPANGGVYNAGTGTITWTVNALSGTSGTLTWTADIIDTFTGDTLPSTATLTHAPSSTSLSANVLTQLQGIVSGGTPQIIIEKRVSKTALIPGDIVTYTLKVSNVGDGTATNIVVTDDIPDTAYFTYVPGSMTGGDSNITSGPNEVKWGVNSLLSGQTIDLSYQMQVATSGVPSGLTTLDNNATSLDDNGTAQSNIVTVTINTNPNLAISKIVSNPSAIPGELITYTIRVQNIGTGDANGTALSDFIPAYMTYEGNLTTTQGTASYNGSNDEVVVALGNLVAGADANVTFKARVSSTLPAGTTTITNTADVAASNAAKRSASAVISAPADVNLTIDISGVTSGGYPTTTIGQASSGISIYVENATAFVPGNVVKINGVVYTVNGITGNYLDLNDSVSVTVGTQVVVGLTYSLLYQNVGDADANNTTLTLNLGGLEYYGSTGGGSVSGGIVTWDLNNSVTVGTSNTLQVTVFPTSAGAYTLNTSIQSDATTDNLEANNFDSITLVLGGLTVEKSTSTPVLVQPISGTVDALYSITITNTLPKIINDVNVTDTLPSGFIYAGPSIVVDQNGTAVSFTSPFVGSSYPVWSLIDIPANGSVTINFIATIDANTSAATHQNAVLVQTNEVNTSISQYEELSSTAEDVTVIAANKGLVTGYVFLDSNRDGNYTSTDRGFSGINVTITSVETPGLFYVVSTDANGYFSRDVGEGNWTVSYVETSLTGYQFTIGTKTTTHEVLGGTSVLDLNGYKEPIVTAVTSATVTEGTTLVHTVTINGTIGVTKTYSFTLVDNTTTVGSDYNLTNIVFSNGVTYDSGTGLITVPAGVTNFTVRVPSINDTDLESTEWYDLTIGGVSATGTILDNDTPVANIDYGDLPVSYFTVDANAPRHTIGGGYLGSTPPDAESDGQPSDDAKGDDNNTNEEDGIVFLDPMVANATSELNVTVADCPSGCNFSMWIDFNQDGDFDDANEQIAVDRNITTGVTTISYTVPSGTNVNAPMYAMARLSTQAGLGTTGLASDGEIETYFIPAPSSLPITISYVYPNLYGNSLEVEFATATEVANIGFNIYAIQGDRWIKLNEELIEGAMDSFVPIEYSASVQIPEEMKIQHIGIAGIDVNGQEDRHGPFKIGHESGEKEEVVLIDWNTVNKEVEADKKVRKAAKKAKRESRRAAGKLTKELLEEETVNLEVSENAIYRVTHEALVVAGIDLTNLKTKDIAISFRGEGVARYVGNADKNGKWTKDSWIEFKGEKPQGSDALYIKANNYQLELDKELVVVSAPIEPMTAKELVFETNAKYGNTNPSPDPFYDGFFYTVNLGTASLVRQFDMPLLGKMTLKMRAYISFTSDTNHNLSVLLNGTEVANIIDTGILSKLIEFNVDSTILNEGINEIKFIATGQAEGYDIYLYDKLLVSYDDGEPVLSSIATITLNEKVEKESIQAKSGTKYVMITHPLFMGEMLEHYINQRSGEGWSIQLVNVEDIYEAYGYGMATPAAIQAYLKEAQAKGVTHVQLVGAASYDYHDYLGLGSVSFIPSIYVTTGGFVTYTPSDTLYVADENSMPQIAIGRWPVRTVESLEAVINKTLNWKDSGQSATHKALFIADKNDGKNPFATQMDSIAQKFEIEKQWTDITRVYLDDYIVQYKNNMKVAVSAAKTAVIQSFTSGPSIVSYSGHSAPSTWSYDGLLKYSAVASISNEGQTALVLPLACYTAYADSPLANTMAHQLIAAGEHGAVAVYGATLFSSYASNGLITSKVIDHLFNGDTIGEAVLKAKREMGVNYRDAILNGSLLGDVTLRFEI